MWARRFASGSLLVMMTGCSLTGGDPVAATEFQRFAEEFARNALAAFLF
jgi:hypothetical protein